MANSINKIIKKQDKIWEDSYEDDNGIRRWFSNDQIVPPWVYEEASLIVPEDHLKAYDVETSEFLADYRERMADYEPSAEELFEMKAAFGEGETVVNVFTGRSIQL